jgi:RNA polymerase sigma-70 factor (ECF subfamily)
LREFILVTSGAGSPEPARPLWTRFIGWLATSRALPNGTQDSASQRSGLRALPSAADEFEAFYHEHERNVCGYLWRITGDEQVANDLTQEVFVRAWSQFAILRGYDKPDAWLFHVATNLALNERRRQRVAGPVLTPREDGRAVSDHAPQVAEGAAILAALDGLQSRQRAAIILRELYGYSCDEIAAILDVTRAAAKMTLSRARAQLRALYLKEDAE